MLENSETMGTQQVEMAVIAHVRLNQGMDVAELQVLVVYSVETQLLILVRLEMMEQEFQEMDATIYDRSNLDINVPEPRVLVI